ncbi:hypothetical protein AQUCO_01000259v1 [Aquilegia coerulea]|uniref:Glycosyltransferase n=1 Tax=Aquilegia coerulea TaxID=218851 RepID=A0A2G5E933_AQUCA|nr:hypothetical protein AQUCO_01000259v1 [Aquilegia coerulea]
MNSTSSTTIDDKSKLHVVMFPWLAIGHLIPFLELSKCLASKGHHVSFISTPRNIQRLPKIPQNLSPFINLVNLPFPQVENLPKNAQSSTDIPMKKTQLLKRAFDGLQVDLATFLENSKIPIDWIIYDFASHWLPEIANRLNIPCVYFCLFTAATLCFYGPPYALLSSKEARLTPESFTIVPNWIPFPSDIVYRLHEILPNFEGFPDNISCISDVTGDVPDTYRFGVVIRDCDFIALRSCVELEPEWISFLSELNKKTGYFSWSGWTTRDESVVYVALGTEAVLSQNQSNELALGLERSELPFFWVLRAPPESYVDMLTTLPNGFEEKVKNRGMVWTSWAPQVNILAHRSVGGFLTHCGWNSLIEGLGYGRVPVLLPMLNDQGLNARLLVGKKLGLEIPRNEQDGSFTSESVAELLRLVMVEKEGEVLRCNARKMKGVFCDENVMGGYMDVFIGYLQAHKRQHGP